MTNSGSIDVRVGTTRDEVFTSEYAANVAGASFTAITDDIGRFRARIDGVTGFLDEVYIKPGAGGVAPDPAYRIRIFDEFVDGVEGRVLLNVTGQTEGPIVVDRAVKGTFVIEITGGGAANEVTFSFWLV